MNKLLFQTTRAAGMTLALHQVLTRSDNWSALPRDGIPRLIEDIRRELITVQASAMPGRTLIEAQEMR